jgi:SHS2 domain-containing protein
VGVARASLDLEEGTRVSYEFFDHTGDIGVRVSGATVEELFADAATALTATLVDLATVQCRAREWVGLEAPSLELLLVDWLNDLVFRFDVDEWLVARATPRISDQDGGWKLEAAIEGESVDPARHHVRLLIKGVTYHQLAITQTSNGFETTVIFDI